MADPPRNADADADDTSARPDRDSTTSTPPKAPRWVKVAGIIVGVLVLLFVILQLTGVGGQHGPGRHVPGGDTPPASVTGVHTPPAGGHG